jgi:hypothetical protein
LGRLQHGTIVIKFLMKVIHEVTQYACVFFTGKLFQPSPMFMGKAGAYLREAALQALASRVGFSLYPLTTDKLGKTCQGQTL